MLSIAVKTFGCKVNFSDSQALIAELVRAGYDARELDAASLAAGCSAALAPPPHPAVVIANSCCVTAEAERKARQFVRRLRRQQPDGTVLFTGCAARHPRLQEQFALAGAILLPTAGEVVAWLQAHHPPSGAAGCSAPSGLSGGRTRAFIKVQDGCCNHCSYCIVPQVRTFASRPEDEILAEVDARVAEGHRELVLTGINVGHYGLAPVASLRRPEGGLRYQPIPGHPDFYALVRAVVERLPAGTRLRLSSIEPDHFDLRLLELMADPRLCPHLHLPLQSGSDAVLGAMRRRYRAEEYRELARRFRAACPSGALTSDLLVGYPTETEQDFQATLDLCQELGFERVHGFPFSPRPGTPAAELPPLPPAEVAGRNRRLLAHCRAIADQRWRRFVGTTVEVLFEEPQGGGWTGYGAAYQLVQAAAAVQPGRLQPVELLSYRHGRFEGQVLT